VTATTRVLQVLGRSEGGIARHVAQIVGRLEGTEGLAFDIAGPTDLPVAMPKPVVPIDIPGGALWGHRPAVRRVRALLGTDNYDVVHAHGLRAAIDAGLAARSSATRVFASVHNVVLPAIAGPIKARVYRRAEPLVVRLSDRTFSASEDIARRLRTAAPRGAHKVEVLHLGVDDHVTPMRGRDEVRAELGVTGGKRLVVTVARLAPQKALGVLVRAIALLPDANVLALVGSGPSESELRRLTADLKIEHRVRFLGRRTDAADFIAAGDVFCLSSIWEACALAAQEAMHLGVPVVSTDVGGMPELITDRVSGRLVPAGDAHALSKALAEILDYDAADIKGVVDAARRTLAESFSIERMLARLKDAYRDA
jgi:glycosyltransferase involved in cell wall biosynthesis